MILVRFKGRELRISDLRLSEVHQWSGLEQQSSYDLIQTRKKEKLLGSHRMTSSLIPLKKNPEWIPHLWNH